jgi:hypothetical protein
MDTDRSGPVAQGLTTIDGRIPLTNCAQTPFFGGRCRKREQDLPQQRNFYLIPILFDRRGGRVVGRGG